MGKSAPNDPKMALTCTFDVKSTHIYACYIHPRGPFFYQSYVYNQPFSNYGTFLWKGYRMTPNDFAMFKVKNNICILYASLRHIFTHFTLQSTIFELYIQFCVKSVSNNTQMTLTCSRLKYTYAYYMHTRYPNFHSLVNLFWVIVQFGKSAPKDPKMTLTYSSQRSPYGCY